jgi:hypothetical protein
LDLGRRNRPLTPLTSRERVRVAVGQRDRGRRLACDLGERATRPTQRQQHTRRAPPEPERDDLDPGAIRESGAQLRQADGVELRADRQRHLDRFWKAIRPGHAQEVRTVDVDDVERQRNLGDPLGLRHELLGEHGWSHDVEDMDPLEQHRPRASEPSGRQRLLGVLDRRRGRLLPDRLEQTVPMGEMAIERRSRHTRGRREIHGRRGGRLLEQPPSRLDDLAPRPLCAGSRAGHSEESTRSRGDLLAGAGSPLSSHGSLRTDGADRAISCRLRAAWSQPRTRTSARGRGRGGLIARRSGRT